MPGEPTGLEYWRGLQHLSEADVLAKYNPEPRAIERGVGYFGLTPATRIQTTDGHFYFRDDQPALLYLNEAALERGHGPSRRDTLLKALGEPEAVLASRAGRVNRQYIYPAQGIALSASADGIDFVELFPPTDLETYRQLYYKEPAPFTR